MSDWAKSFTPRWRITLGEQHCLFAIPHVAQINKNTHIQLGSSAFSLSSSFSFTSFFPKTSVFFFGFFSHTLALASSFLPCTRLLLFNSGRPDVHLITALPSRRRAGNSLKLFSPAALARGEKTYSYRHKYRQVLLWVTTFLPSGSLCLLLGPQFAFRALVYFDWTASDCNFLSCVSLLFKLFVVSRIFTVLVSAALRFLLTLTSSRPTLHKSRGENGLRSVWSWLPLTSFS